MKETLNIIKSQQKSNLFYFRFFTKFFSIYLSYLFIKLKLSPNFITCLMLFPGLLGSWMLNFVDSIMYIFAGFFLILHDVLDTCDGEVARFKNIGTKFGEVLDEMVHLIVNSSIVFFSLKGIFSLLPFFFNKFEIYLIFFFLILSILDHFFKLFAKSNFKNSKSNTNYKANSISMKLNELFFGNIAFFHMIFLFGILDTILFNKPYISILYIFLYILFLSLKAIYRLVILSKY